MSFPRTTDVPEQQPTPEERLIAALNEAAARRRIEPVDDEVDPTTPAQFEQRPKRRLSKYDHARLAAFAQRGTVPPEYRPKHGQLGGRHIGRGR